jgi:hypothetical protein
MARRPAIRIKVQKGSDFQIWTTMASESPRVGSFSQFGPSSKVSLKMSWLITPHSGFSMKRKERMVGIEGTAQGRMKSSESQRIQVRCTTKKPDSSSATNIFRFTPTVMKMSVLTTVRKKIGSSQSAT